VERTEICRPDSLHQDPPCQMPLEAGGKRIVRLQHRIGLRKKNHVVGGGSFQVGTEGGALRKHETLPGDSSCEKKEDVGVRKKV